MKKILNLVLFAAFCLFLGSCGSSKHIAYFQNADTVNLAASKGLFDARIMPKDLLTITVSTTDPKAATPFNLSVTNTLSSTGTLYTGAGSLQTYLVDNDGFINFPVVGQLKVGGMTKRQCENYIREKIIPYMAKTENPIVTVKMASFKVTVAGELIREDSTGLKTTHRLNLNDANLINSPYYYLQQNDYIYVEPNKVQAQNSAIGSSVTIWFSVLSVVTSVASLVVNVVK